MQKTRALLYEVKMPNHFWSYAVYAATYILNRCLSSSINYATLYKKWNNRKPKLKYVPVFRCVARRLTPDEKRTKLQPKSKDMLLIGYSNFGYVNEKSTVFSSNVLFDETKFYPVTRTKMNQS